VAVIRAYLDACQGRAGATYLVIAGFFSWPSKWDLAETRWRRTLASYNVAHFRTADLRSGKAKPYRDWTDRKKQTFEDQLVNLIKKTAFGGVAPAISITDFEGLDVDTLSRLSGDPHRLMTMRAMHEMCRLLAMGGRTEQIAYLFESGDKGQPGFIKAMLEFAAASDRFKRALRIHSITAVSKSEAKVFDMADLLAWEVMRHAPKSLGQSHKPMSSTLREITRHLPLKTPFYDRALLEQIARRNTPEYLKRMRIEFGVERES
jgi:hypothetical protein